MSTVHGSPYWNPVALGAQPCQVKIGKEKVLKGWEVKEYSAHTQKMQIWGHIFTEVFDGVIRAAKLAISNASQEKKGVPFVVNPLNSFNAVVNDLTKSPSYKGKVKTVTDTIIELAKTYITNRRGSGAVLILGMMDNLQPVNQFMFSYSMRPRDLQSWRERMYVDSTTYFYHTIANLKSLGTFALSQEDKEFLDESQEINAIDPEKISCFAYALLKVREAQAKKLILDTKRDPVMNLITFKDWSYRIVEHPDEGDLVLYMNDTHETVLHIGVFRDNETSCEGLVESKLGINISEVFLHRVFDIPANYGTRVVFMRKTQFSLIE